MSLTLKIKHRKETEGDFGPTYEGQLEVNGVLCDYSLRLPSESENDFWELQVNGGGHDMMVSYYGFFPRLREVCEVDYDEGKWLEQDQDQKGAALAFVNAIAAWEPDAADTHEVIAEWTMRVTVHVPSNVAGTIEEARQYVRQDASVPSLQSAAFVPGSLRIEGADD